ncbi:helix-turn-helix transcriptional regulator [Planotetraspora kaengkrachanensis]|uniref:LuxR family transcriptional regulator n=1 Tax=Planotetraspora kaengkrachanensis TaxID=575193 RepID=A0A8J3M2Q7_9ACTN|nr:LuxR family transcriptional regulator [Planotetraspora kaengkrachanensis]GIG78010.1 LuxR family transcriptional regulator [Planotetraspora kaengkrachanensis]
MGGSPSHDPGSAAGFQSSSRPGWRGREREWAAVAGILRAATEGRGGVVLVEGQMGMGKSRLLHETAEVAERVGFTVLRGTADELSQMMPLMPLIAALGESPHALLTGMSVSDVLDLRLLMTEQLRTRLESRAAQGPVLVTLDDLHWADSTTMLALRTLASDLASYPLVWMLALARGAGDDPPRLDRLFEALQRDGATPVQLGPLPDDAVAAIVADVLQASPGPDVLALSGATGGNPFLLVELLGKINEEGAVQIDGGHARLAWAELPWVRAITRKRLDGLTAGTRHMLQVAAILGRSFAVHDLAEMLGEPASRLLPGLEEATGAGVLVTSGDLLAFRHDLLRQAVTDAVPPPVRLALRRQAGEMLLNRGGSTVPAAAHLVHSARPGDTRALDGLDRAAREVLCSSPQTAADLALRALELTADDDSHRLERTAAAVDALTVTGRLIEAAELVRESLATLPDAKSVELRCKLAIIMLLSGQPGEAIAEAEIVLAQPDLSPQLQGMVELAWFKALIALNDFKRGQERAEAVLADPGRTLDARVGALLLLAHLDFLDGRVEAGLDQFREAVAAASDGSVAARLAHPRLLLARILTCMRRLEEAETNIQAAEEEVRAAGHTPYAANPAFFRARLRLVAGRMEDAAAEAQTGLSLADEFGPHAFELFGHGVLAIVAVRTGDIASATRHIERYRSEQVTLGLRFGSVWGLWAVGLFAEATGGPQAAKETLKSADAQRRRWLLVVEPPSAAWMTRIALMTGDPEWAEEIVLAAERLKLDNPGFPVLAAAADHARGLVDGDSAKLSRAAASFRDPWSRASASEDLGALLGSTAGASDTDAAVLCLEQALEGYDQVGALRDVARVRARLRQLGVRRRHWTYTERPSTGWGSLTETESTVASLVAHGLTNRQVATRMFLSPHTVSFHLRQVFRKLGIGSRVELARLAAELAPEEADAGVQPPSDRRQRPR